MRAKKDDIPDYLRPDRRKGPWRALAILGVGSAIFCGLVAVFAKPIVIDVAQLKQSIRFGGEPVFSQQLKRYKATIKTGSDPAKPNRPSKPTASLKNGHANALRKPKSGRLLLTIATTSRNQSLILTLQQNTSS